MPFFEGDFANETGSGVGSGYDLSSNTGKNDPGSAWGTGFLSFATGFGNTAANIAKAFKGNPKPANPNPVAVTTVKEDNSKLWLIGGAVVVGLIAMVLLMRK